MLVGLLAVIYSQILPGVTGSTTELFVGVAAVVVVNAGFTLAAARAAGPIGRRPSPSPPGWRERRPRRWSPIRCWAGTTADLDVWPTRCSS